MEIAQDSVVGIVYTLKDAEGKVLDSNQGGEPLHYLQGHGNLVPGLEKVLLGKKAGENVEVVVSAAEGYGERDETRTFEVPKAELGDNVTPVKGMGFTMRSPEGTSVPVTVMKVKMKSVVMDGNHPLAGKELHFSVEVKDIRKAKKDEIKHRHAHGKAGHSHGH